MLAASEGLKERELVVVPAALIRTSEMNTHPKLVSPPLTQACTSGVTPTQTFPVPVPPTAVPPPIWESATARDLTSSCGMPPPREFQVSVSEFHGTSMR